MPVINGYFGIYRSILANGFCDSKILFQKLPLDACQKNKMEFSEKVLSKKTSIIYPFSITKY